NGTYLVSYTPELNGKHEISVTIQDKPIKDSPCNVLVINCRGYNEVGSTLMEFACDQSGHIYVADCCNHRVQVFGTKGEFVHFFGAHGKRKGEFNCPTDVAVDTADGVTVCDNVNNRVRSSRMRVHFWANLAARGLGTVSSRAPGGWL
ncbi:E3 ubiquitin- ligase TRIM71-like, partial [Paramuricea clavata]